MIMYSQQQTTTTARMEQLIPVINRLQDVMSSVGVSSVLTGSTTIDLPQIAVVGSQSVGKSSVLESLVGRDFLPRGSGIVTRRPLILQLRNVQPPPSPIGQNSQNESATKTCNSDDSRRAADSTQSDGSILIAENRSSDPVEWGEFGHAPGVQFDDFEVIRKEIERETDRMTGKNKGISPTPILLKIFSPYVIDLTLIDLPGITKVPVGDQPADVEIQIRRMIYSFISKPNCIVLAVTAANTDLANSDALQMAREVDPDGRRTVGVITKCDLMDADTDALDMLIGKVYPLNLGYVGVVCRSQKDINKKTEIRDAIREEERFFRTHPSYRQIAHRCGTRHLAVMLNQILMRHIQETLPELRHRIHILLQDYENELQGYGDPLLETQGNPGALLLHFFSKFARNFQDAIEGRLNLMNCSDQLTGGARINYIFHDWFGKALAQFDPLDGLSDLEIRTAIRNATGPKASLFVPEGAFEILVRKQIGKLEAPALSCVEQVYEELQKIVEKCELPELTRFQCLRERLLDVVKGVLKRCLFPTNQMISNLIQMELAYFNTNHPDFVGGNRAATTQANSVAQGHQASLSSHAYQQHSPYPSNPAVNQQEVHDRQLQLNNNGSQQKQQTEQQSLAETTVMVPNNVYNHQLSQSSGRTSQVAAHSPHVTAGALSCTPDPQPSHLLQSNSDDLSVLLPSTPQQPTIVSGFLGFFKGSRGNSGTQSTAMYKKSSNGSNSQGFNLNSTSSYEMNHQSGQYPQQRLFFQQHLPSINTVSSNANDALKSYRYGQGLRLPQVPTIVTPNELPSERERTEIELIKSLIISYFSIVRKNVADYVPKSIMSFMVNTAKDVIQRELVSQLYKEELFDELLREGDDVADARRQCKATLKTLRAAIDIVNQIRDVDLDEF